MGDERPSRLDRLGEAFEVYHAWKSGGAREPVEEWLGRHAAIRDLLEPLVGADGDAADGDKPDGDARDRDASGRDVHDSDASDRGARDRDALDAAADLVDGIAGTRDGGVAGRTLGGFRLVREIGRGGMGVVFEAEEIALRRRVALKVLPAHLTLRPEAILRFRNEAAAAGRLRHSGIVEVLSVGEHEGTHFFAMELVEGESLEGALARLRGRRPDELEGGDLHPVHRGRGYVEAVVRVAAEVADALDHAHRAGIVHRDVKPSNVLLRGDGRAVLTDFGLARDEGLPSLTRTGTFAGTPHYLAPEQARGGEVDARTDVYALGVTLYEMLTLRRPFDGETTPQVIARVAGEEPQSPRRLNPSLPPDLATIVLHAMEKEPARRYASAAALAADLGAFLAFRPIAARPSGVATRVGKLARRNRAATTTIAALAAAGVIAAAIWWAQPGVVEIACAKAGAAIFVDGVERPERTAAGARVRVSLRPGLHVLRVEKPDEELASADTPVLVSRGAATVVEPALASLGGVVHARSVPPGARVVLTSADGRVVETKGTTPLLIDARAGRWTARFELQGFAPKEIPIEILPAGQRIECEVAWETGAIAFECEQEGTRVAIFEGNRVAAVPVATVTLPRSEPLVLPAGVYSIRAERLGCDRRDLDGPRALRLEPGKRVVVPLWLSPLADRMSTYVGGPVDCLVLGDVDGDGLVEIAVGAESGEVSIWNGDGRRLATHATPGPIVAIAPIALPGAGRDALVAASVGGEIWRIDDAGDARLLAPSDGVVATLATAQLARGGPRAVLVGAKDGRIIALTVEGERLWSVRGRGTVNRFAAADLDGDGLDEVVSTHWIGAGNERVQLRSSDGAPLGTMELVGKGLAPAFARAANGRMRVGFGTDGSVVQVFDADGTPVFKAPCSSWVGTVVPADLDGDGADEWIVGTMDGEVSAFEENGERRFRTHVGSDAMEAKVADLDGDGRPEIVAPSLTGAIVVLDRDGTKRVERKLGEPLAAVTVGDVDGDGLVEIVVGTTSGQLRVVGFDPGRVFEKATDGNVSCIEAADLDGDGRSELIVGVNSGELMALAGDGSVRWERRVASPPSETRVLDVGGGGAPTLALATRFGALQLLGADGEPRSTLEPQGWVTGMAASDRDAAGRQTLLLGTETSRRWRFDGALSALPPASAGVSALAFDGRDANGVALFVEATTDGRVARIGADGSVRAAAEIPGVVYALAPIAAGAASPRRMLAGCDDGRVAPLDVDRAALGAPWAALQGRVATLAALPAARGEAPQFLVSSTGGELRLMREGGAVVFLRRLGLARGEGGAILAAVDLDGDGVAEIVAAPPQQSRLVVWKPRLDDPRVEARRRFEEAVGAAERGDEPAAAAAFGAARLRWLALDAHGLGALRARLRRAAASPSAARMAALLDRVRPADALETWELASSLVACGRFDEARDAAASLRPAPSDEHLLRAVNETAWRLVEPGRARGEAVGAAEALAAVAVDGSRRNNANYLDTLAEAIFLQGRADEAVRVEMEALAKCPPGDSELRRLLDASLARYRGK